MGEVCGSSEERQPKNVAYGFEELTLKLYDIYCQRVGGNTVWFDAVLVEDGHDLCCACFLRLERLV